MTRKPTITLALILAGGLAAGIGLARPSTAVSDAAQPGLSEQIDAPGEEDAAAGDGNGYRTGTRTGNRGGTPAPDGGNDPGDRQTPPASSPTISIENFDFAGPETIAAGVTLTVRNLDGAPHTLTFRAGDVDTGTLDGGATATITAPSAPGVHEFFCAVHPSMEGEITVAG